jgi:transcriptional regulator with XRE-family HTH domain
MPTIDRTKLAGRLILVRQELFGLHGGPELARRLGIPARTWLNYEQGITVPGAVVLAFILETRAEPRWLSNGTGPQYRGEPLD